MAIRLFCDQCGTELDSTTLRADSKFCSICGKALSDFIKSQCGSLFKTSPKAQKVLTLEERRGRGRPRGSFRRGLAIEVAKKTIKWRRDGDEKEEDDNVKRDRGATSINGDVDSHGVASIEEHQDSEGAEVAIASFVLLTL